MVTAKDHYLATSLVQVEGYWIGGAEGTPAVPRPDYILTETVRRNLKDVARIVALCEYPILLQGETSVGKTSLISYLAEVTGNRAVRINNHEHTDVQEYVGSYSADESGAFRFQEGVLAQAMRHGYWIILDELNLANTEILEALNRVLDDNRELFIPENQVCIRAHSSFRLFATQNPAGATYGGRKTLSRAFRNRFVELHFDELCSSELEEIIHKKCAVPSKLAKKMIRVLKELQQLRRASAAFQGKRGFITLRDLFRWGSRYGCGGGGDAKFFDFDQCMAEEGFLVLAARIRDESESGVVRGVIEKVFKRTVDPASLFSLEHPSLALRLEMELIKNSAARSASRGMVWTRQAVRMAALLLHSFRLKEPVLLVGETGCGKTSVSVAAAEDILRQSILTVNCHLNTEATDFLGGLRPRRNRTGGDGGEEGEDSEKLFEWADGPLVKAMLQGHVLLIDEISLADDSVIERVNSVLEEGRELLIPERAAGADIKASNEFQVGARLALKSKIRPKSGFQNLH